MFPTPLEIVKDWLRSKIATLIYRIGVRPNVSTGICGTTTFGYGDLDPNGYWQYQVPRDRLKPKHRSI